MACLSIIIENISWTALVAVADRKPVRAGTHTSAANEPATVKPRAFAAIGTHSNGIRKQSPTPVPATMSLPTNRAASDWPNDSHVRFMRSEVSSTAMRLVNRAARIGASRLTT